MTDSGWFGIVGILEHSLICLVTDSGWFGIVGILEHVDPFGDRFSVSDSGVRSYYPGVRSWKFGDRFRYTGVRFLVPDSDILVTDPGDRFGRRPV